MFPLGTVLLPGQAIPLHIFEARYRALVGDCLAGAGTFGVVLIERGSEVGGGDVRTDVGCLARIVEHVPFDDGRCALGIVGTARIRVCRWLDDRPYPRAVVEHWPDPPASGPGPEVAAVAALLRRDLARRSELGESVPPATFEPSADPATASFELAALAPFGPADRQQLLAAADAAGRLERLRSLLVDDLELLAARVAAPPPRRPPPADDR